MIMMLPSKVGLLVLHLKSKNNLANNLTNMQILPTTSIILFKDAMSCHLQDIIFNFFTQWLKNLVKLG